MGSALCFTVVFKNFTKFPKVYVMTPVCKRQKIETRQRSVFSVVIQFVFWKQSHTKVINDCATSHREISRLSFLVYSLISRDGVLPIWWSWKESTREADTLLEYYVYSDRF